MKFNQKEWKPRKDYPVPKSKDFKPLLDVLKEMKVGESLSFEECEDTFMFSQVEKAEKDLEGNVEFLIDHNWLKVWRIK